MSSNKSKRSQKLGSSRRSRHNRDAGVKENDKQLEQQESQDNELHTVSETQPGSDPPAVVSINEPTSTLEPPALSQLQDDNDPSARANVASKKKKMGSTRKNNRREVQEPSKEELERTLDVTGGVPEELEVTEDVSVKEEGIKEHYEQAEDAIIKNDDVKEETIAGPADDFSVRIVQECLHSDVMPETTQVDLTTTRDMLSVTDHTESNEWTMSDNVQQHSDVATNVISTEGFKHEIKDQAVTSDLMSQPQNDELLLDIRKTITTNKESEIKEETERCEGTDTSFIILSTDERKTTELSTKLVAPEDDRVQQDYSLLSESITCESNILQDKQLTHNVIRHEENTSDVGFESQPLGSFNNEHDLSKKAESGQNYFSDPATECKVPSQVNNQEEIFFEQLESSQHTGSSITNENITTPNENQESSQNVQKWLNNLVGSATPSKSEDNVLNSVPDQASSVVTEEDKQETVSTHTLPSSDTDFIGVNKATEIHSIALLNENEKDKQCLNSPGTPIDYSRIDPMGQEDGKNVITKASTENVSDHGVEHKEDHLQLNTDLPCVEVICAKEVTEENKVLICSNQEGVDKRVVDTTYLKQTVQPERNISETSKQKEQLEEDTTGGEVLHHNPKESVTEHYMVKIDEDLNKSDHDEEIKADVSEAMTSDQLLHSNEISDFVRETVLIPAVSLYEEMQATDSGELPSETKMQSNKEDSAPLESSSPQLSDINPATRLNNEAPFHLNNTVDKDSEKESSICDDRNPEILEKQKPQENLCDLSTLPKGEKDNTEETAVIINEVDQKTKSTMAVLKMINVNTEHGEMLVDDASHDSREDSYDDKLLNTGGDAIKLADLQQINVEGLPPKNEEMQSFEEGVIQEAFREQDSKKAGEHLGDKLKHDDSGYHGEVVDCAEIIKASVMPSGHELADVLHEEMFSQTGKNLVPSGSDTDIDFPSNTLRESVMEGRPEAENSVNVQDNDISPTLLAHSQASVTSELVPTNTEALLTSGDTTETVEKDQLSKPNNRDDVIPDVTPLQEANIPIGKSVLKRKMGSTRKTVQRKKNKDVDVLKGIKDNCEIAEVKNEVKEKINTNPNESLTSDGLSTVATAQQYNSDLSSKAVEPTVTNIDPSTATEKADPIEDYEKEKRDTKQEFGLQEKQQLCPEKEENELAQVATDLLTKPEVSHAVSLTATEKETVIPKDETGECGRSDTSAVHQIDSVIRDELTDSIGQAELNAGHEKLEANVDQDSKFTSVTKKQNDTLTDQTSMSTQEHDVNTNNPSASQADHPSRNLMEHNTETNSSSVIPVTNEENVDESDQNENIYKGNSENLTNTDQDSKQFETENSVNVQNNEISPTLLAHSQASDTSELVPRNTEAPLTSGETMKTVEKDQLLKPNNRDDVIPDVTPLQEANVPIGKSVLKRKMGSTRKTVRRKINEDVDVLKGIKDNCEIAEVKNELKEEINTNPNESLTSDGFSTVATAQQYNSDLSSKTVELTGTNIDPSTVMENKNKQEETEKCPAASEVETISIVAETSYQSTERLSVASELLNIMQPEKTDNSGPYEEVHLKETVESDTILTPKQIKQEDHGKDEQFNCEAGQLKDEILSEENQSKNEEYYKEENFTADNDSIESMSSDWSLLSDVSSSKIEDFEIQEQTNKDGVLSIKKENDELSLISNMTLAHVTYPMDDTTEDMKKETAEVHTTTETQKRKFGSKRKFQKRQQPNIEQEIKEWDDGKDKEIGDQTVDQEATPNLLTEPQMSLVICDPPLLNQEILDSIKKHERDGCERIDTPPIMLSNVHQIDSVIPETKDTLVMPEYKANAQIVGSEQIFEESEKRNLEDLSKQNKITEEEQSLDVHLHESKSGDDNLITENPVNIGQRRKMGSTRKGLRVHFVEGQKERNLSGNNEGRESGESRVTEDSTESIKTAANETERCEKVETHPIMLSNILQIDNQTPETTETLLIAEYKEDAQIVGSEQYEPKNLSYKITEHEQTGSPNVQLYEIKSDVDNLKTENPVTSVQKRKMGSTRKGQRRDFVGGQIEGNTSFKNEDKAESRGPEDNLTESIKQANEDSAETILQDSHCGGQITKTSRQDDHPQTQSNTSLLSEIVCELEKSNQLHMSQSTEAEQYKGPLQIPASQSSETPTPPSSPGKRRKMGSSRKISRNKPSEITNSENTETNFKTENLDTYEVPSNITVEHTVTADVQGSAEPIADLQAPYQTDDSSTTTTEHQGKRKFGSRRAAKDCSGLGVHKLDNYEVDQEKTDIQKISEDLKVSDPFCRSEAESTAVSQTLTKNLRPVMATEAGLVSLHDITKTSPPDESTEEQRPKINFEQWNEPIPDFGLAVYNVVMVGDSNVGKTSFIRRLQSGNFSSNYSATIGVDTFVQTLTLGNRTVKLYIWDTAGQERYHSITRQVFHKAQGLLLMYDISSAQSFQAVRDWITQVQEKASADVIMMLLGNKNDCGKREVEQKEGEDLSKEYNIHFMECSAATGYNVSESMKTLAWLLVKQRVRKEEDQTVLQPNPQQNKSGCC